MKKMWISALLAAAMMTAAGATDAPSAWAQKSVDAARAAGLVPSQVDSAFDTPITREDFCSLAAAVYRAWDRGKRLADCLDRQGQLHRYR